MYELNNLFLIKHTLEAYEDYGLVGCNAGGSEIV
jgi:hypothetical protein